MYSQENADCCDENSDAKVSLVDRRKQDKHLESIFHEISIAHMILFYLLRFILVLFRQSKFVLMSCK
jgi:hypothetical protein